MTENSKEVLTRLGDHLRNYSIELTPGAAKELLSFQDNISQAIPVYVTFLPNSDFAETLKLSRRLKEEAYTVIPHIAVRNFHSKEHLRESLEQLMATGIRRILLIGGSSHHPQNPYDSVLAALHDDILQGLNFESIAFAGHPEGNADVDPKVLYDVLKEKKIYSDSVPARCYLVTQFCFDPQSVIAWAQKLQADGIDLPLHIGVHGVASVKNLIKHAKHCGLGPSIHYLRKNTGRVRKLLGTTTPEHLLTELVKAELEGKIAIERFHFYPLGGWKQTRAWLARLRTGNMS